MKNLFYILMLATVFAGCNKSKDAPDCKINSITPSYGSVFNFYYNESGKISVIREGEYATFIEYKGDSVIATIKKNFSFLERRRFKLNAQGLPLSLKLEDKEWGNSWYKWDYEYAGNEIQKSTYTTHLGTVPGITSFVWKNGNLITETEGQNITSYEYHPELLNGQMDAYRIQNLSEYCGLTIAQNKNVLKSKSYTTPFGSYTHDFRYNFNKDDKIMRVTHIAANVFGDINYDLQFLCK